MELIDSIPVHHGGVARAVNLYTGDLAAIPAHEAVDVLVVSAFPNDYLPTRTSLIGALHRVGVSVADLARDKEVDLRSFSSCWLSRPIQTPNQHFRRILCFEPAHRGAAPEVVGDIFRSIVPFATGTPPVRQIAMPLVASGDQGEPAEAMLEALVDAAVHWLAGGLTLDTIKVVLRESDATPALRATFARAKERPAQAAKSTGESGEPVDSGQRSDSAHQFDVFISYCHKDKAAADELVAALKAHRPSIRIFLDRLELRTGSAWQQHIFESLDASRKVVCLFSPAYIASKVCTEEFNIALMRHRDVESGVLLPVYLRTAGLPGYMRMLQYEDVREGDSIKIAATAEKLASVL